MERHRTVWRSAGNTEKKQVIVGRRLRQRVAIGLIWLFRPAPSS
jgi:hypothetical protein